MKWGVYNILFALVYPFLLPGFLARMLRRGGYAARMGDRFALYPRDLMARFVPGGKPVCPHAANGQPQATNFVWIHAVSVGEVQVAGQLMREWRKVEPDVRFCFSTTSSTGWKMAQKEVEVRGEDDGDVLIYNPLDFPNFVKSALKTVRPRAIVLTESEIWPNFILTAKRYGIPLFLVNARVSDRSAPRYRLAKFFFKDVLSAFTRIFAQSELDRRRLIDAGAPADRVSVTGSFKFDVAKRNEAKEAELREWIFGVEGRQRNVKILLGASTWPGEDEVLLRIYKKLLSSVKPLLVLAPRHFEKADQVEANIVKHGFACIRRSRGRISASHPPWPHFREMRQTSDTKHGFPVYLCDTTGEMMGLFGICDVAFVGKSLCAHGSQNMIEPCLCGKPTVVGPYTENFRPVMSDLLDADAVVQVPDEAELEKTILHWFAEGDGGYGARAAAAVKSRCGVVRRCVAAILSALALGCSRETPREKPVVICNEVVTAAQCICDCLGGVTNGLNVLKIDARHLDCNRLFLSLTGVPDGAMLWMPGEFDWLFTWPADGRKPSLAAFIDRYAALDNAEALAKAGCDSVPAVFASYVGTVLDVRPAFAQLAPDAMVAPELFVTKTQPTLENFDFEGLEADVREKLQGEIRSHQNVRRIILEGCIHSRKGEKEAAVEAWARAAKRHANDTMLIERLDHLRTNGEVFYKLGKPALAAQCYDVMAQIRPNDPVPVFNYGVCAQRLGRADLAEAAFERARKLDGARLTQRREVR